MTDMKYRGWIKWEGGVCPVPARTQVVLRRQDGKELTGPAGRFEWQWGVELCEDCDIAAYRVIRATTAASDNDVAGPAPIPALDNNLAAIFAAAPSPNAHYRQGEIECIDAIRAALTDEEWRGFCKGSILQYVWREKHKGGNDTLVKAQDYLRWAIAGKAEGKR